MKAIKNNLWTGLYCTGLGTQRCPGSKFVPPIARTWTIFTGKLDFHLKVDTLNLKSQNQTKTIPEFPNQALSQIGPGCHELWSYKQTNKQTNRNQNFIYV